MKPTEATYMQIGNHHVIVTGPTKYGKTIAFDALMAGLSIRATKRITYVGKENDGLASV